jgi:hypothetical protein
MVDPKKPVDWSLISAAGATVERQEVLSRTGTASMKIANLTRGGVYQRVSVQPGLTAIRAHFYSKNPVLGNPYGTLSLHK